jgi:hypothetical protein
MSLQLQYGTLLVGELSDVIEHQGTWFGSFRQTLSGDEGPAGKRLCDYISFCRDWDRRIKDGLEPDAAEFDDYLDLRTSGLWHILPSDGTVVVLREAPYFFHSYDEVTWLQI